MLVYLVSFITYVTTYKIFPVHTLKAGAMLFHYINTELLVPG